MFTVHFESKARSSLKKLSPDIQKKIITKIEFFASSSNPLSFAKRLKEHEDGQYRFRIGDYRVIFDLNGEKIMILTLGHRREIYK